MESESELTDEVWPLQVEQEVDGSYQEISMLKDMGQQFELAPTTASDSTFKLKARCHDLSLLLLFLGCCSFLLAMT